MNKLLESFGVQPGEIEFQVSRSSGPGGQNVNKVNSKVTLRWNLAASGVNDAVKRRFVEQFGSRLTKTGEVIIHGDQFRDQGRNKEDCLQRLAEMIASVLRPPKKRRSTKPSRSAREKRMSGKKIRGQVKSMRGKPSPE